jgi:ubiquinone/menaquinone biosynthesis C-methylase UbiE
MNTLDYNQLAADYARHRRIHPGVMENLIQNIRLNNADAVLEVGCGSGNYITAPARLTGCRCWGIDPSNGMLEQTRPEAAPVVFRKGRAEQLDFPEGFFDLILSVDAIHHVADRVAYFREAYRALRPGGRLCTATDSARIIRGRRPLCLYFPETIDIELKRYPRISVWKDLMSRAGRFTITENSVEHRRELTGIDAYRRKAFSSLHLIPEATFRRGLAKMEQDLQKGPLPALSRYLLLWGVKEN